MSDTPKIIYTLTDEAPALATHSLLPIIDAYTDSAGIRVETRDISLAGRIIAHFPDYLTDEQKAADDLAELGEMTADPSANIIKLPNISASVPQLKEAIAELQNAGYKIPDYPEEPETDEEKEIAERYEKVKGSAVNPVLRQGNSDRRAPASVKDYARKYPHRMGAWESDNKAEVAHMDDGDFYATEKSTTFDAADKLTVTLHPKSGDAKVLKKDIEVTAGEVVDTAAMHAKPFREFIDREIADAKAKNLLFSVHLKATMMKVSDPIMFGWVVTQFYKDVMDKFGDTLHEVGFDPRSGLGDLYKNIQQLPDDKLSAIESEIARVNEESAPLAMVDSHRGISVLHWPNDIIIDASMPAMIRDSGMMWGADDDQHEAKALIPDRCYAGIYAATVEDCKKNGAFDPTTMGTVPNVGLMAQKAEEYGSHDKTFQIPADGTVRVTNSAGETVFEHEVDKGDIWRMCLAKDAAIADWVKLAVTRARDSGMPAVFWLDENRAHDAQIIAKVNKYLPEHDTDGLDIRIMEPVAAMNHTLERVRAGKDTISVTGNVLRDYLTDLFPIMELGTSAKMLSIVPLMAGGGLFETGAGGSAPKHVRQLQRENHLRWDSLGEFLALAASLEHLGKTFDNQRAKVMAEALDQANSRFLSENKSPSRKVGELDNRGSHFYLAMFWARAIADQKQDSELAETFAELASALEANEAKIVEELNSVQGEPVDLNGYYFLDPKRATEVMRPSVTLNETIAMVAAKRK
ncbi:NADP-dependent isocitrate dehydrogenase [Salinisphaera hydrothermalis]|uniref:Isocitrate dehydrogenase [NADP] n=1 Tax=Salinisphaera hydrothermalis (strain C41B8) TaxID=1304275 RepID=A0A084ING8_SALHC|nr:NADP-dependent isocitrate dehydrogenase [Salinisphaera hydrothermalis]KEZ78252.1 isocitrate dehydrogenase [Salinisphaera hydrothermalis C41B8]